MNTDIAVNSARAVIKVLRDVPPVVPPGDAPLASVLISRNLKLARGYKRYVAQRRRGARRKGWLHTIHFQ